MKNLTKITSNGCGGKGSRIRPPYAVMFKTSCDKHDELYEKGGNEIDRYIADIYLLEYLKLDVYALSLYKIPYFFMWAYLYYYAVRLFGKKYFNYNGRNIT